MAAARKKRVPSNRLPRRMRSLFWDHAFGRLRWESDRDLIIGRILPVGDWESVQWLLARLGEDGLREWLVHRHGAGLSPKQLRFWELILGLEPRLVDGWLKAAGRQAWDRRRERGRFTKTP